VDRIERDILIAAPPESGFEERGGYKAEHEAGWTKFVGQLREYAEAR
jgi:hypothetical protein